MVSERKIDRRVKQAKELTKDDVEEIKVLEELEVQGSEKQIEKTKKNSYHMSFLFFIKSALSPFRHVSFHLKTSKSALPPFSHVRFPLKCIYK